MADTKIKRAVARLGQLVLPSVSSGSGAASTFPTDSTSASSLGALLQRFEKKWCYLMSQPAFRLSPMKTMLHLLSWRIRCFLRVPATVKLRNWGVRMFLPPEWRGIAKLAFVFRERYERELLLLQKLLSPGMTFVDAGACYGIYTLAASKIVGSAGSVLAFEPAPRAFRILQKNVSLNSLPNVTAYSLALTTSSGKALLYRHPNVGCDSLGKDDSFTSTSEVIATESLDSVLGKTLVSRVDVIKIDVQGAEEWVLRGATEVLNSNHPVVIFEVYPPCAAPLHLSPRGAWDFLASLGYEFFVADSCGKLRKQLVPPTDGNVVAIHLQSSAIPERQSAIFDSTLLNQSERTASSSSLQAIYE